MNLFVLNILLSLAWIGLTGEFTPANFIGGFVLGYAILWLTDRGTADTGYFVKVPRVIGFLFYFAWEVIQSNLKVMAEVFSLRQNMKPGIVAIPLDAKTDLEITMFANLITLTPGTLSLDVSEDRSTLYVHSMFVEDAASFRKALKEQMEKRLLEVLR